MNPKESFNHWFVVPLEFLKTVPNNDGSFVALASALFLYERYIVAKTNSSGEKVTDKRKIQQVASDFAVSTRAARIFWNVMRHGILHQGMPKQYEHGKQKQPDWVFDLHRANLPIELHESKGTALLVVQPWLVVDKVVRLWLENLHRLEDNESFPWAQVSKVGGSSSEQNSFLITGSASGLRILGIEDDSFG